MSDANVGIISVKTKRQTRKVNKKSEKNKYQTSKKKNKQTAFLSISRRQRSLGHRASAHHFLSRPGGIDAGQNMKVRGQDSTPRRRGFFADYNCQYVSQSF